MDKEKTEMSFLDHLEVLRWHIIKSVIAILLFATLAFLFKNIIFDEILLAPRNPSFFTNRMLCHFSELLHGWFCSLDTTLNIKWLGLCNWFDKDGLCINSKPLKLISVSMGGQFSTHMMISLIAGIILASPVIVYQFWSFIAPALHSTERKKARGAVLAITALFLTGVLFGYYMIVPFSIDFLGTYNVSDQIENTINLTSYFSTVASITLASGVIFELPAIAFFLGKIGVITASFMKKYRRHAIVIIFILAALITPPDAVSQVLVSIPLLLLYELSIFIVAIVQIKKKQ